MRTIIAFILLLFTSCVTTDKALNKIAGADKLKANQDKLLATICSIRYPQSEYTSNGTTTIDSTLYNQVIVSMQEKLDLYKRDYDNLTKLLKNGNNTDMGKVLDELKKRSDSLSIALSIAKEGKIPCPKIIKTDTTFKIQAAELAACKIENNQIRMINATNEVEIARITKLYQDTKSELDNKPDRFWSGFKTGAAIAAALILAVGFFLKFKRII